MKYSAKMVRKANADFNREIENLFFTDGRSLKDYAHGNYSRAIRYIERGILIVYKKRGNEFIADKGAGKRLAKIVQRLDYWLELNFRQMLAGGDND